MLGFWIIVAHLVGAYLTTSEYIQHRAINSTTFAAISVVLYMIPFILFLPGSILSFAAIIIFRLVVVRFSVVDRVIWAKNLLAPKENRVERVVKEGELSLENASISQVVSIHAASLALHAIFIGIAIILL